MSAALRARRSGLMTQAGPERQIRVSEELIRETQATEAAIAAFSAAQLRVRLYGQALHPISSPSPVLPPLL